MMDLTATYVENTVAQLPQSGPPEAPIVDFEHVSFQDA